MSTEAHVGHKRCFGDNQEASNNRCERCEERSPCVKRLKLSESSTPSVHCVPSEDEESAHNDLQILKSLQRLNSDYDERLNYVVHRYRLVRLIFDLGEQCMLRSKTVHRAINYMDRLLSKLQNIPQQSYNAFVAGCVLVAGMSLHGSDIQF